jgi:predicted nucleic acid-binding Zn ribbon protein
MNAFRTPSRVTPAPNPDRLCVVCGAPLEGRRRAEAKCCSGRCRIQLSRARRLADLATKLAAAESALAEAAEALGALRELAAIGSSRVTP